ncbi:MAG: Lrp/AsnC family transcriptional regulator [Christensenellales bacterium]
MPEYKNEIIEILQDDARTTPAQIAEMLGISEQEAAAAIKQLEDDKVILKYSAAINKEKLDDYVFALIEVKVTPQREQGFEAIAERIYRYDEVMSMYLISGDYDFMVMVKEKSMKKVSQFVHEKLAVQEHVISTSTHFVLKNYKENGVAFTIEDKDYRLVVAP